jgi:uncharacterized protein involved in type VI secretion and phage assembly
MHREPIFSPLSTAPPGWAAVPLLAQVLSLDDPESRNRVQVALLSLAADAAQAAPLWARVVAPMAGDDRGLFCLPDVGDEVLVLFAQGDLRAPLIIGGLWNGSAAAPADIERGGDNRTKRLRTKNGITITLDDQSGTETLTLETPGGQKLTLSDGPGKVTLEDSNGNRIELASDGITITASASVTVNASSVKVSAGLVTVDAGMSKFSGVVKCDTLITNAVVSSSYTPGAGNVW